jgi:DNA-damage-inducible protein J
MIELQCHSYFILPFDPLIPNAKTVKAMKEARKGRLASFDNVSALMAELNADD